MNKNKKGFTLAELLIVVAIIAVLVAIAIPIFTTQLEKAREATDLANIRSAYAEVMTEAITDEASEHERVVTLKQKVDGWTTSSAQTTLNGLVGNDHVHGTPQKNGTAKVRWEKSDGLHIYFEGSLPVTLSEDDLKNNSVLNEKYGQIVSYLFKKDPSVKEIARRNGRYDFCGIGATDDEKVKIWTYQTGDGQTIGTIKSSMKKAGYSDKEIEAVYSSLHYAYFDDNGNLLGYNGSSSGGQTKLYIVGYNDNPVSAEGVVDARNKIAEYIQTNDVSRN